ncbi:alpha/beta hydrolase [uncultured Sulfitobacter sp.]|uniref:alpha/beta hydrolase n=1 Tax=uncultured Sulfitobacter sp. TaxID=191468 RepID=UPI0026248F33|nr:alpha/beta hydrolase [uncultured Sulfitobacter sp.]
MSEADYEQLLDDEVRAYIARSATFYPPGTVSLSIDEQRAVYDRMCDAFNAGRPEGVRASDLAYGNVPCRLYEGAKSSEITVIYYHGGGFVVGGLESHDDVCAEICARTGFRVVAVDYALAPEHRFPACYNDALAAYTGVRAAFTGPILLMGDSAGGNLASGITHAVRPDGRVIGQVLIYPELGADRHKGSFVEHAHAPELTAADVVAYRILRFGVADPPAGDPRYFPLQDRDLSGLPSTVILTVECDPLASNGPAYRDAVRAAGGQAEWINGKGLVHGCLRARHCSVRAGAFFDQIVDAVDALGQGRWPY